MGSVYKRGKFWYIDLYVKGRRIRRKTGSSKQIALLALKDAEVKAARDEFGFIRNDISLDKFFDLFLEYSRTNHQPKTTARYRAVVDHFREFLLTKPKIRFVSQTKTEVIDKYKLFRKNSYINPNGSPVQSESDVKQYTRKGVRAHTINFEIGALKTIFNLAIKWDYLKENPTKDVVKLKVNDSKPVRFLTKEECTRLLEASPPNLYPIFFTYLNTGMRKAELENLEWDDIDFARRKIKIRRKETWQPKTGEREIPIGQSLLELLEKLIGQNDQGLQSSFVFPHSDGGRIRTKLRERLIKVAKHAGIENLTMLHTLRHTFASHLVMKGVDLPTVKSLMGHSDIQTTMIYAHLAPDHLADAIDKLEF
jgi:integrase